MPGQHGGNLRKGGIAPKAFIAPKTAESNLKPVAMNPIGNDVDIEAIHRRLIHCHKKTFKQFQRGILTGDGSGGFTVRTTGDQGSGILSSMSQANCFIVLGTDTGNVAAGERVDVQLLEGLI